jgi:lysophospholipase L1-like esterase
MRLACLALCFVNICLAAVSADSVWTGSWSSSQQIPEPANALPADDLRDATLRQIVHLSVGGTAIRIHISNVFGVAPLHLLAVHVGRPLSIASGVIDPASDRALKFASRDDVIIPAGSEYVSDALPYAVAPAANLAVSIRFLDPPQTETGHPGSRTTSFVAHGDYLSSATLPNAKKFEHWYQLSAVDVLAASDSFSIVVLGDSITDGHGATTNGNNRWPDQLASRLRHTLKTVQVGVLNAGIGGNRLLDDGLGPNALARFDRDVLVQTSVRTVLVLEGVNDLGTFSLAATHLPAEHAILVSRIVSAYDQLVIRAHARGLRVIGCTILPYGGSPYYHPDAASEADRQAINRWVRSPGHFDGVIDFDKAVRDPNHPDRIRAVFDSGDHLHPSPAGYAAMANAVPLTLLAP